MNYVSQSVFCPIHGIGCGDVSCDGVLPVQTHEDCHEYEDGETRLRLICLKGDSPYELPSPYTKDEIDKMVADFKSAAPKETGGRHYATRQAISVPRAAKLAGVSESTIKRLDKAPKNTKYPGRNVDEYILEAWGKKYRPNEKIAKREVRAANRPLLGNKRQ